MSVGPDLSGIEFSMFTSDEVRALSVVEVTTPLTLDALGHPLQDGLYDPIMGPFGINFDPCKTCNSQLRNCPGHFGHIELPVPVVNPLYHKALSILLRLSCTECFTIQLPSVVKTSLVSQLKLLDSGYFIEAQELKNSLDFGSEENVAEEVLECLVEAKLENIMKTVDLSCKVTPTKIIEKLKNQFVDESWKMMIKGKKCTKCKNVITRIKSFQNKLMTTVTKEKKLNETKIILPEESKEMLRKLWGNEGDLLKRMFPIFQNNLQYPTDIFFIDVLLVTPPKTRPVNIVGNRVSEHVQTMSYKSLLETCIIFKNIAKIIQNKDVSKESKIVIDAAKGKSLTEKLHHCWQELQANVDCIMDATQSSKNNRNEPLQGLKQTIEKKQGVVRMHMMGKRVNYAARSVITPDPNLNIEEIGVPEDFAKKLTCPVTVTYFSVEELRKMVINGPDVYPGANIVEYESGSLIRLQGGENNRRKREGIAKMLLKSVRDDRRGTKIVHRHLLNGDVLLLNRQPTLHRPSIMAHMARILKNEKTFRMHYSNCKSYNADFDGDEMNAHCPQNDLARSEAYNLANVCHQYLVPKDGTPLGGLIQDHMVSGVRLTVRGQFFDKNDYNQLIYHSLSHQTGNIILLPPAMLKPKQLWSGKQLISTILLNIIPSDKKLLTLVSKAKINDKSWQKEESRFNLNTMSEGEVIIRNGHLICGVLDKQHYGATQYSLTHCLYELYDGNTSTKFLSCLAKLFTAFLQLRGFTIGVEDILVTKKQDKKRRNVIKNLRKIGDMTVCQALDLDINEDSITEKLQEHHYKDVNKFRAILDRQYKTELDSYTNDINRICLSEGLIQKFPDNNLQLMVTSGAKGSTVNTMQISCLLGQIELEGKRPPLMLSGRSLPSFRPFETSPRSGGFVDGRFMTGIRPQEFFFHCMAGREGLIDTAVKTSRSGYLQRCLIKHLEGVLINYDMTVRDTDGSVLQYAYGEDGQDISKSKFLNSGQVNFLYENRKAILDKEIIEKLKRNTDEKEIKKLRGEIREWFLANKNKNRSSGFTRFSQDTSALFPEKYFKKFDKETGRTRAAKKLVKKWNDLDAELKKDYVDLFKTCPDPVCSKYKPDRYYGSLTEKLESLITDYLSQRHDVKGLSKSVRDTISLKSMLALAPPGEPVGLLAAQSIGEPSTQMTLNTFHFAGRGEMNVTLGIPRLREILLTASKNIKTPYMDIPFYKVKKLSKKAEALRKTFQRVTIADVLQDIIVDEYLELKPVRQNFYAIRFEFLPLDCYKNQFVVTPESILQFMENKFLAALSTAVKRISRKQGDMIYVKKTQVEKQAKNEDEVDEKDSAGINFDNKKQYGENHVSSDEDEAMEDDDATQAKVRSKHEEAQEYEEPDESEVEMSEEEQEDIENDDDKKISDEEELNEDELEQRTIKIESRKNKVINSFGIVQDYKFDVKHEHWCEITIGLPLHMNKIDISSLLKDLAHNLVIYQVPNIKRAIVYENNGNLLLKTDGINIDYLYNFNKLLNVNKLYSNDIHKVASVYGIEAAGRVIVKEIKDVFNVYGITVDSRHLSLVSDYMTFEGEYLPMNRMGMQNSSSPLQQISFESSLTFLKTALLQRKVDQLQSASSRIMVGSPCLTGTGICDVWTDLTQFCQ